MEPTPVIVNGRTVWPYALIDADSFERGLAYRQPNVLADAAGREAENECLLHRTREHLIRLLVHHCPGRAGDGIEVPEPGPGHPDEHVVVIGRVGALLTDVRMLRLDLFDGRLGPRSDSSTTSARKAPRSASVTGRPVPLRTMVSTSPVVPAPSPVGGRLDRLARLQGSRPGRRGALME